MSKLLLERSENHNNIVKLAELIIKTMSSKLRHIDDNKKSFLYLINAIQPLLLKSLSGAGFSKEIKSFIKKSGVRVRAMNKINTTNGQYYPSDKRLYIYISSTETEKLYDDLDGNLSKLKSYDILRLLNSRKTTLIHELQHAFDDYRSDGKFVKKIYNSVDNFDDYVKSSHEISAFFTATVDKVLDYTYKGREGFWGDYDINDFNKVKRAFKLEYPRWESLDDTIKKKLLTRLGILYNEKIKKKDTNLLNNDITSKIKEFCIKIRKEYNTDDFDVYYYHSNSYLQVYRMKLNSVEDEEEVMLKLIKIADTYRKTIGISLYKNYTSIYLTKSRALLRTLGFFKNYGTSKADYRFREEWIRYTKRIERKY